MAEYYDPNDARMPGPDDGDDAPALPEFLTDPFGVIARRWPWMLLATLVGLAGTVAAVLLVRPTYLAEASILVTSQQIPEEFVRSTVKEDTISNINAMVGEVLSRERLSRMIDDLGLKGGSDAWSVGALDDLRRRIEIKPEQVVRSGRRGESSMIYGVDFRSGSPEEAAAVANALATLFTEASLERRSAQARRTTEFLKRQLERDEAELRAQSQRASEFRRTHRGELPSELDTNMRRLELLSERQRALQAQVASKENQILALRAAPPAAEKSENELLLDSLRQQLATESAVNTDEHPNVIALRQRIERLSEVVAAERSTGQANQLVAAERREVALLKSQLASTQDAIAELSARIDRTPAIGEELAAIEQKENVMRERYLASLRKVEDSQLAENLESAQQGAQITILDPARAPSRPEVPRWMIAAAGVAASLGLALAVAVLLELVDPVVVSMSQLERIAEGPCLGSLPYMA